MVIAMRAAHFVSWGPLSAQDMGLVWLRHFMCSHKKEITHLFRKSLCIRMRISSLTRKLDSKRNLVGLSTRNRVRARPRSRSFEQSGFSGTSSHVRQPFCSQLEERLLLWLEYNPRCGQDMVFWENPPRVSMGVPAKRGTQLFYS